MSGDPLDLDAIEARANALMHALDSGHVFAMTSFGVSVARDDVPALVAEVRRLRARVAVFESVDNLARSTGYSHAEAAGQIRAMVDTLGPAPQ